MTSAKTYLVCGAANRGIGEAITKLLVSQGHAVIGTYDKDHAADARDLEKAVGVKLHQVDYTSRDNLAKFLAAAKLPQLAGFVFADMFFAMENPDKFDYSLWDTSVAVNLSAPNYLIHSLKSQLVDRASIVVVTSTEGFIGSFGASAYAATKAAIHNLIKSHANNLGSRNIRVNAVAPGWIGGVMDTDEVFNMSRRITPLGRLGTPEEVASSVNFLLSAQASFVNGTVLVVDGGYSGVDTISKYEFDASKRG